MFTHVIEAYNQGRDGDTPMATLYDVEALQIFLLGLLDMAEDTYRSFFPDNSIVLMAYNTSTDTYYGAGGYRRQDGQLQPVHEEGALVGLLSRIEFARRLPQSPSNGVTPRIGPHGPLAGVDRPDPVCFADILDSKEAFNG
jgi:hypothetical protein